MDDPLRNIPPKLLITTGRIRAEFFLFKICIIIDEFFYCHRLMWLSPLAADKLDPPMVKVGEGKRRRGEGSMCAHTFSFSKRTLREAE